MVDGERIVALAQPGSEVVSSFAEGAQRIDATGRLVVPGAVDVHTHMEMPFGGTQSADTFETGRAPPPGAAPLPSSTSPSSEKGRL